MLAVSRSSYHHYLHCRASQWERENISILNDIKTIYQQSRGTYGSPRITQALHQHGYDCSRARVARIMTQHGIVAKTKRRFKMTTDAKHRYPVAPNLLNQDFKAEQRYQKWISDITYIRT